jgi:probable HAF family extracellular repeat protein
MRTNRWTVTIAVVVIAAVVWWACRPEPLYRVTVLPSLDGAKTVAMAVNDRGQVVGAGQATDGRPHAFLWDREHGLQNLGMVNGHLDLNDANQVVFCEEKEIRLPILRRFFPPRNRHYLWDPNHGRILLDPYVLARAKGYFRPMDINNKGWIVGIVIYGSKGSPRARAVVLEPIPQRWQK